MSEELKIGKMWNWACDGRIRREFKKISAWESAFLIIVVVFWTFLPRLESLDAHQNEIFNVLWWAALAVLVFRINIFRPSAHWPLPSLNKALQLDRSILCLLLAGILVEIGVLYWHADAIFDVIKLLVSTVPLYSAILSIVQEEIWYRLVFYYSLDRLVGRNVAFFCSVVLFILAHLYNYYYAFTILFLSTTLLVAVIASGSILVPIVFHGAVNFVAYLIGKFLL